MKGFIAVAGKYIKLIILLSFELTHAGESCRITVACA